MIASRACALLAVRKHLLTAFCITFDMSSRRSARLSTKDLKTNGQETNAKSSDDAITTAVGKRTKRTKSIKSTSHAPTTTTVKRKAAVVNEESSSSAAPVTPLKRRAKEEPNDIPLTTPTSKKVRPANPKATNAPLQTPGGTRVIKSYPSELLEQSATSANGGNAPAFATTTANILDRAVAHLLAVDPRLQPLISKHTCTVLTASALNEQVDPFNALCSSIMGQQVSGAAAASIKRKFIALFEDTTPEIPSSTGASVSKTEMANNGTTTTTTASTTELTSTRDKTDFFPSPAQVAATSHERLRTAGLSGRKAEYIQGLAEKFSSGELSAQKLIDATDDELLATLIAVRGLGRWSVEMFAFFALKRLDIFSTGDLGVQRGMAAYVGRDVGKLKAKGGGKWKYMKEEEMLEIANRFVPYRSLFMWYMWRMEDVNLDVLSK